MVKVTQSARDAAVKISGFASWEDAVYWGDLAKQDAVMKLAEAFAAAEARGHARSDAERDALVAEVARKQRAVLDLAVHLAAAISLLESGGKAAKYVAGSDRMFDQLIRDYKASLERGRAAMPPRAALAPIVAELPGVGG